MTTGGARTGLSQRLRDALKSRHMTQAQLASASGVAIGTIRNILNGSHAPRTDILAAVAGALGTSVSALTAEAAPSGVLAGDEKRLLDVYRSCDGEARRALLNLAEVLAARPRAKAK